MGNRFTDEYVYIIDKDNVPHYVMSRYMADLGDSYRSDIYLKNKSYCVHDLYLTDEVEEEGEYLPYVKEQEWRDFLPVGPSENASMIIAEAGLADISISKLVFVYMTRSSGSILEFAGFVSSAEGVQDFDPDYWTQAVLSANDKTGSVALRCDGIVDWIVEQVRCGNFTPTK